MKCFHFCTKEFYDELKEKGVIYANDNLNLKEGEPASLAKAYLFATKRINNGNGMFFAWNNPSYKGEIKYGENGDYVLLELEVPDNLCVYTDYEEWCGFGMDLYDAYTWLMETGEYHHGEDDIYGHYGAIFIEDVQKYMVENKEWPVQILIDRIDTKWIVTSKTTINKFI